MKKLFIVICFALCTLNFALAQDAARMQWFKDAKLGIFIHWGIYAVNGIDESWSFYNENIPYEDYIDQLKGFTAENYNPDAWAVLFRESGARYAVLTSKHHDGVVLWDTDGDWEQSAENWHAAGIRKTLLNNNPDVIINSRLTGYGDYATPEQGIPVDKPSDEYWELCMTMNDSWGYQPNDKNYKPVNLIIRIFADVIGMGGNLLLDIGPKADGSIPEEQLQILQELGTWTSKHSEAIYGTLAGIPKDCYYGPSTLSTDSTILYLFVATSPSNTPSRFSDVLLKGITNNINAMWAVGNGAKPEQKTWLKPWWSGNPGLITIEIPMEALDAQMTVIAVQLDGKIALKF